MAILLNGERTFIELPQKEKPKEFKAKLNQKKDNDIKSFCNAQYSLAQNKILEMVKSNLLLTAYSIKQYILQGNAVYTILDL